MSARSMLCHLLYCPFVLASDFLTHCYFVLASAPLHYSQFVLSSASSSHCHICSIQLHCSFVLALVFLTHCHFILGQAPLHHRQFVLTNAAASSHSQKVLASASSSHCHKCSILLHFPCVRASVFLSQCRFVLVSARPKISTAALGIDCGPHIAAALIIKKKM